MITISLKSVANQIIKKRIIHFWAISIIYSVSHLIIYLKTQNYISVWTSDFFSVLFLSIIPIYISYYFTKTLYMLSQNNKGSFLTAKWKNLILINYEIDARLLEKYVPKGTEIDLHNGKCYISLVGFLFQNTKLLGLKIPFHVNFEEINLRFYVKRFENNEWKRGVVFIKEIVPKPALSFIANTIYKEHYQTLPTKHSITKNRNRNTDYVYQWKTKKRWNTILIETENKDSEIESGTTSEFITEHYFGYTKYNENKTFEYEVKHPKWNQKKVIQTVVDIDFKETYGNEFEFLNKQEPAFTIFALGSKISVETKKTITHEYFNPELAHNS